ncbi:hypothetical protein VNO78_20091 [Psophocarpus tetragonolobus]|uniref:Uncharacterized protein n=1 Tax=Psophocarpus tetragonolobus TaxID=3891 RepID=A0AAN9XGF2_PSOTE
MRLVRGRQCSSAMCSCRADGIVVVLHEINIFSCIHVCTVDADMKAAILVRSLLNGCFKKVCCKIGKVLNLQERS